MSKLYLSFTILAFGAITLFALQNLDPISVKFLSASIEIPKVAVISGSYLLGMITGWGLFRLLACNQTIKQRERRWLSKKKINLQSKTLT